MVEATQTQVFFILDTVRKIGEWEIIDETDNFYQIER